jgi:hypothetical protein
MDSGSMSTTPIADHALLSDCHSAALVDTGGSVEWLCFPRFDSPSTFARLLDDDAGHWSIRPRGDATVTRRYLERTMVVETTFRTPTGAVTLTDALGLGVDTSVAAPPTDTLGAIVRRNAGGADPVLDLDGVEADQPADLQIRDTALLHEATDKSHRDAKLGRQAVDVEERVGHRHLCVRVAAGGSHAGQRSANRPSGRKSAPSANAPRRRRPAAWYILGTSTQQKALPIEPGRASELVFLGGGGRI